MLSFCCFFVVLSCSLIRMMVNDLFLKKFYLFFWTHDSIHLVLDLWSSMAFGPAWLLWWSKWFQWTPNLVFIAVWMSTNVFLEVPLFIETIYRIHNMCTYLIDQYASEELKSRCLPDTCSMEVLFFFLSILLFCSVLFGYGWAKLLQQKFISFCLTEPDAGSDAGSLKVLFLQNKYERK